MGSPSYWIGVCKLLLAGARWPAGRKKRRGLDISDPELCKLVLPFQPRCGLFAGGGEGRERRKSPIGLLVFPLLFFFSLYPPCELELAEEREKEKKKGKRGGADRRHCGAPGFRGAVRGLRCDEGGGGKKKGGRAIVGARKSLFHQAARRELSRGERGGKGKNTLQHLGVVEAAATANAENRGRRKEKVQHYSVSFEVLPSSLRRRRRAS